MIRFLAMVWSSTDARQFETASQIQARVATRLPNWKKLLNEADCCFYALDETAENDALPLPRNHGIVLGTVFRRSNATEIAAALRVQEFSPTEVEQIISSNGRHLTEAYWGSYIALLRSDQDRKVSVLRSPMCKAACLLSERGRVHLFFSNMQDVLTLGIQDYSVNWGYVARSLLKATRPMETGLHEIRTLSGGDCVEISNGKALQHSYWGLLDVSGIGGIQNSAQAESAMRQTIKACVGVWGERHNSILVRLSGGLDSSIVLGCLKDCAAKPRLSAVTFYSEGPGEDERAFARIAASRARCELLEVRRNIDVDTSNIWGAKLTETPRPYLPLLSQQPSEFQAALQVEATAIASGTWGDQLFYVARAGLTTADLLHDRGLGREILDSAYREAKLKGRSVWSILWESLYHTVGMKMWSATGKERRTSTLVNWGVALEMAEHHEALAAPWYRKDLYLPPGKQFQLSTLWGIANEGGSPPFRGQSDPDQLTPLLAQPLVELCLQIPTHILAHGGRDRDLVRRAMVCTVPPAILERTSKGVQDNFAAQLVNVHRQFIRELLLDGHLVSLGLLDKPKLESILSGAPSTVARGLNRLARHVSLEIWLQLWKRQGARMQTLGQFADLRKTFAG